MVTWLTPSGVVASVVKGAVRPKSFFLGQYDLNYTCDVVYYRSARNDVHALRECFPLRRRDALRGDYRALALAGHFRRLAMDCAPAGPDCAAWFSLLEGALDGVASGCGGRRPLVGALVRHELDVLHLMGLEPELEAAAGAFRLRGERSVPVSAAVADYLRDPLAFAGDDGVPLDAARVIGVFYQFHLGCAVGGRRTVLSMISQQQGKREGET